MFDQGPGGSFLDLNEVGPGSHLVQRSVSIRTVDEHGQQHEYSSLKEVPPETRSQIEALEKQAAQESGTQVVVTENSLTDRGRVTKSIRQQSISLYKVIDQAGVERLYHSLEEMPPEIRSAVAEAQKKSEDQAGAA